MRDSHHGQSRGRFAEAADLAAIPSLSDEELIAKLAAAGQGDSRLAATLAAEAFHRLRRTSLIVEAAEEGILSLGADGRLTYMNPAAERLLSWRAEEVVGTDLHSVIHHEHEDGTTFPAEDCPIFRAAATGVPVLHHETAFIRKDGTRFPAELNAAPVLRGGNLEGAVVTFTDISDRKAHEEALRESEARFRALFAQNPLPSWVIAQDTLRFLDVNEAALEKYGYTREEFLAMRAIDIRPPEEVGRLKEFVASHHSGRQLGGEWRHRLKDGSVIAVEVATHRIEWSGHPALVVVVQDVTTRKREQEALAESRQKYRDLVERSPQPIAVHAGGVLLYLNPAAAALMGVPSPEALVGRQVLDFVHPSSRAVVMSRMRIVQLERRAVPPMEERIVCPDGRVLDVEVASMPATWEGKAAVQIVLRDMTAQKRSEEEAASLAKDLDRRVRQRTKQLSEVNDELQAFTYLVSHDLKEPLRAIEAYLGALHEDHGDTLSEDGRVLLEEARGATARLAALLRGLLELSRVGRFHVADLEAVSVLESVQDTGCSARYQHLLRERGAQVVTDAPADLRVRATPPALCQVLGNLIVNGITHNTSPAPVVRVQARPTKAHDGDDAVEIVVEDNGPGFAPDAVARFNETHSPGAAPAVARLQGGFGLIIAARMVERLGGRIHLGASELGGAAVRFTLPRARGPPGPQTTRA